MVETLAAGDWYPRDGDAMDDFVPVLDAEQVEAMTLESADLASLEALTVAVDASPDRMACSVAIAGRRGQTVVGYVGFHGPLVTADVVATVLEVCEKIDPWEIVIDPKGPASVVAEALDREGLDVTTMSFSTVKAATKAFLQGQKDGTWFVVDPDGIVAEAFNSAQLKADDSGGVKWTREQGVICQLAAVTYAMWATGQVEQVGPPPKGPHVESRPLKSGRSAARIAF